MEAFLTKRMKIPASVMKSSHLGEEEFMKFHEQNLAAELGREFFAKHAGKDMWRFYIEYDWMKDYDTGPRVFLRTDPPYNHILTVTLCAEKMFLRKEPLNG